MILEEVNQHLALSRKASVVDGMRKKASAKKTIDGSIVIDRPSDHVWKFMMTLSNAPKWMPEILELRQTSAGPLEVGAMLERRVKRGTFAVRITEHEPNRAVTYEFTSGFVRGTTDSYRLETVDGKTRVSDAVELKLGGFYRLLRPIFNTRLPKVVDERLCNLRRELESNSRL
ncbi:MAG TPA: SRPBCC family protein [Candidatus Bathyarchaeia archaeon]|nr:SRPBCC family protein [Candidatus Bathyarchaeia archaeon]